MTGLWWCVSCQADRRFGVLPGPPVDFLVCQSCGQGTVVEPIEENS